MVLGGQTPKAGSEAGAVCPRTVRKWVDRYEREILAGLQDRSSRRKRLREPTPQSVIDRIEGLLPLTALLRRRCLINACRERCHNFRPDAHQGGADFAGLERQIAYAQATKIRIAALVCRDVCECDGDFHMRAMSVL